MFKIGNILKNNKTKIITGIKKQKAFFGLTSILFSSTLYLRNKTFMGEEMFSYSKAEEVNNEPYFKWEVVKPDEKDMVVIKSNFTILSKYLLKIFDFRYLVSSFFSGINIFLRSLQILYVFFPCLITLPYALRDIEYRNHW